MREQFRAFLDRNTGVGWIRRLTESPLYPAFFCLLVFMSFCSKVEVVFATVIIAVTAPLNTSFLLNVPILMFSLHINLL